MTRRPAPRLLLLACLAACLPMVAAPVGARPPAGHGPHGGHADHDTLHYLLEHRAQITRSVIDVAGGVETRTESEVAEVAARIREHVAAMKARLEGGQPIRRRDPLFAAIFDHAHLITMEVENTPRGTRVRETSTDPYTTKLIRAHAAVVSRFLSEGFEEMRRDHPVPPR